MIRPWHIWVVFGTCLAVILTALGWISVTALGLDRQQSEARRQAALEETVRLSLWRMEAAVAPLLAQEGGRPYYWYDSFYQARPYAPATDNVQTRRDAVWMPSPLLADVSPYTLLHFQIGPDGQVTSPQVPTGQLRALAQDAFVTKADIDAATERLARLTSRPLAETLTSALGPSTSTDPESQSSSPDKQPQTQEGMTANQSEQEYEFRQRRMAQQQAIVNPIGNTVVQPPTAKVHEGALKAVWLGEDLLVLARRVTVNKASYIQGCWLNWPRVRELMLEEIKDLLPRAELTPVSSRAEQDRSRMLAALPAKVIPGPTSETRSEGLSPIELSLVVAWLCVLVAGAAVAALLLGTVSLSERRAAFVSAVTHELRTPLTTFQMYSEMLAENMVSDEQKRVRYLKTLESESRRLSHLVENVLAYARLERNRRPADVSDVAMGELLGRTTERLQDRARQSNMEVRVEQRTDLVNCAVRADAAAVGQILFNLIDNACKYASKAADKTIHIETGYDGQHGIIMVRDHGPGVSTGTRSRLFQPFSKSAHEAAGTAPGVGLGLALSRRLARQMNGDLLYLDPQSASGACFVLILPAVR